MIDKAMRQAEIAIKQRDELLLLVIDLYRHGYTTCEDHDRVRDMIVKITGRDPSSEDVS